MQRVQTAVDEAMTSELVLTALEIGFNKRKIRRLIKR